MNIRQKLIILCYVVLFSTMTFGQAPSNDCGENYLEINRCGVDFSVTQAEMGNATEDEFCDVGGSCPINYVNGQGYENFDCAPTGNSVGDDFGGSVENSLWWGFTPDETCSYTVQINITNCCCKDKGSTNAAQYQIFQASATLPAGSVQTVFAYETGVTGPFTEVINVTQGKPVYILLDGLNGSDCDIDVRITPGTNCTGCVLVLAENIWDFDTDYKNNKTTISWGSEDLVDVEIEKSIDGKNWTRLNGFISNHGEQSYSMVDDNPTEGYNYYKITIDGETSSRTRVVYHSLNPSLLLHKFDIFGREVIDEDNHIGIIIFIYEDGTIEKILK